ncbi:methyltransferase family protein [Methylobacterium sp.]|uniref:methyltransferase family protein n=1 Tax=Methylobacterium sp. TaxID=409 RepID=UPI003B0284A3
MSASDNIAGVIAPPPLLYAGTLAAGLGLDFLFLGVGTGIPGPLRYGLAVLLGATAAALLVGASRRFRRAGTPGRPWQPTTANVTDGVYAWTRNPMYLAMMLAYVMVAIAMDGVITLALVVPLVIVVRFGVILREERYLEGKFGAAYLSYRRSVRRWI